jgi:hypothetical protein
MSDEIISYENKAIAIISFFFNLMQNLEIKLKTIE